MLSLNLSLIGTQIELDKEASAVVDKVYNTYDFASWNCMQLLKFTSLIGQYGASYLL